MGLAWTSMGGNALYIEAAVVEKGEGKGGLRTTGAISQLCVCIIYSRHSLNPRARDVPCAPAPTFLLASAARAAGLLRS